MEAVVDSGARGARWALPWWVEFWGRAILAFAAVITNGGKALVTARLSGLGTEPKFIAWGTGAGAAAVTDTAMFAEAPEARASGTSSRQTTNVANDTYRVTGLITATAARTITEVGLFDAVTAGTLFGHADLAGVPLTPNDGINWILNTVVS